MTESCPIEVGLIGWPIHHSLSPALHQEAFRVCGLPGQYQLYPINPNDFQDEVKKLFNSEITGFNVTAPYKQSILPFLNACDEISTRLNAVNTISRLPDGGWRGWNTDVIGLSTALENIGAFNPIPEIVTVFGNGGAARAVLAVLLTQPIRRIHLLARDVHKTEALLQQLTGIKLPGIEIIPDSLSSDKMASIIEKSHLIINATPVGMSHIDQKTYFNKGVKISSSTKFMDLIYKPAETIMMQQVQAAGGLAWNGLEMLVYQAAAAFTIWTGLAAPVENMMSIGRKRNQG